MTTTEIITAQKGRKIKDYSQKEGIRAISKVCISCYLSLGQKKENDDVIMVATQIFGQVQRLWQWLTVEEIALACQESIFSGNAKYGINPQSVISFIRDYLSSFEYAKARQQKQQVITSPDRVLNPVGEEKKYEQWLDDEISYYAAEGKWPHVIRFAVPRAVGFYPAMVRRGWIPEDYWHRYIPTAKKEMAKINYYQSAVIELTTQPMLEDHAKKLAVDEIIIAKAKEQIKSVSNDLPY